MMFFLREAGDRVGVDLGHDQRNVGVHAPGGGIVDHHRARAAIFGDHSFDTAPPADIRQMSTSEKSKWSSAFTFSVLSPNEHSTPWLLREAMRDHLVGGEIALGQNIEHFAPDIAGSTDHGDLVTHC